MCGDKDTIQYALNSIEHLKKPFDTDGSTLAAFVYHVEDIYHRQKHDPEGLIYYEEALQLYCAQGMKDDPSLAVIYHRTAGAYYKLKRYDEALSLYQKTLNIELVTLPSDAETIATTYSDLSTAYLGLNRYDEAILSAEQAVGQLLKTLSAYHPQVVQQQMYLQTIKQQMKS